MSAHILPSKGNTYYFYYEVETTLWKNPFKKDISDEEEYLSYKRQNAYHDLKSFFNKDPLIAREKAFNYLRSMLEVMCESLGKPYVNYWQAINNLQPLLRANSPYAHQRIGVNLQFDDDLFCGVSLTLVVLKDKKKDKVALFNLGVYDDDHKEGILSDVVYSIVELEREKRYYRLAQIPINTEKIDLSGLGMTETEVTPSIMDWKDFTETFNGIDIDDVIDTTAILDRQCELLIN